MQRQQNHRTDLAGLADGHHRALEHLRAGGQDALLGEGGVHPVPVADLDRVDKPVDVEEVARLVPEDQVPGEEVAVAAGPVGQLRVVPVAEREGGRLDAELTDLPGQWLVASSSYTTASV